MDTRMLWKICETFAESCKKTRVSNGSKYEMKHEVNKSGSGRARGLLHQQFVVVVGLFCSSMFGCEFEWFGIYQKQRLTHLCTHTIQKAAIHEKKTERQDTLPF